MKKLIIVFASLVLAACGGEEPDPAPAPADPAATGGASSTAEAAPATGGATTAPSTATGGSTSTEPLCSVRPGSDSLACEACSQMYCCSQLETADQAWKNLEAGLETRDNVAASGDLLATCLETQCVYDCMSYTPRLSDSVRQMKENSCVYAYDGACDYAAGLCSSGTDTFDCDVAVINENSCEYAYDGACDEGIGGLWLCAAGTDTYDCSL